MELGLIWGYPRRGPENTEDYVADSDKKTIAKDLVVSFHYTLKNEEGEVIDSSEKGEPLAYLHGHDNIVPGLERALAGKKVGYKGSVELEPEDGYGLYDEDQVFMMKRSAFPDKNKVRSGATFQLANEKGEVRIVRVVKVGKDEVTVDGNHPLAGIKLFFDVEVVELRAATKEEIEHGHAHTPGGHHH